MRDHPPKIPSALDPLNLQGIEHDIRSIPQADRVKLAMLLVRDIDADTCVLPLRRLASQAGDLSETLMRDRFERECG